MTESDWKRSQARQVQIECLKNGTTPPDVMIDNVLNIFFARVGLCLLTRAEIMMQGEHAQDERKQQCRDAYVRIQRAMKEHAQRLGFGRRHENQPAEIPATIGNGTSRTSRKRDREDDRRSLLAECDDSKDVARVSSVRDEERERNNTTRDVPTRTGNRKRVVIGRRRASDSGRSDQTTVQRTKKTDVKVKTKRSTVALRKRKTAK